jgi:hypothetical protein
VSDPETKLELIDQFIRTMQDMVKASELVLSTSGRHPSCLIGSAKQITQV